MSETETRRPVRRLVQVDAETLRQLRSDRDRYKSDRDDAWAKCASGECESAELERERADRLRGVVEAVRALWCPMCGSDAGDGECSWCEAFRAALASVPSSGETESGTARLIDPTLAAPPLEDLLRGSEFEGALPAPASPEPTGADGLCLNCFAQGVRAGREEADGRIAAALVARPVLSREAVREQLDGHWLEGDHCTCDDWRADPKSCFSNRTQWRDHLAAVLVGQEER